MDIPDKEPPPDLLDEFADCAKPTNSSTKQCSQEVKVFIGKPVHFLPRRQTAFRHDGFTTTIGEEKKNFSRPYLSATLVVAPDELDMNHTMQLNELKRYFEPRQQLLQDVVAYYARGAIPPNMPGISLRLINWLVTNLAQIRSIVYHVDLEGNVYNDPPPPPTVFRTIELGNAYLQAISPPLCKVDFDPCKRHARILFPVSFQDEPLKTTLGQLNLFRWINRISLFKWMVPRTAELMQCHAEHKKLAAKRKHQDLEDDL